MSVYPFLNYFNSSVEESVHSGDEKIRRGGKTRILVLIAL